MANPTHTPTKLAQRSSSGGIPASALAPAAAAPQVPTKLAASRGTVARGELVELPGLGTAYIELLGHNASNMVEAATFDHMAKLGLPAITLHAYSYDMQRYARTLAIAARDPDDPSRAKPFGTLEEWQNERDDIIFACSLVYKDVKDRLDPTASDSLSDEVKDAVTEAFKKKEPSLLRSCGVATLVSWLLSGAVQLSNSPTRASNTGESSPE